ncbi:glycosyltransferase [soil metagenome]
MVVPTYARARFLDEAVASVLGQTVDDLECLVVDDASPAPVSCSIVDDRVRVIRRTANGGPAAARNTGMAAARGRYVAFLDDDDRFTEDRLAHALAGLERAPVSVCWSGDLDRPGAPARGRVLEGDVRHVIRDATVPHVGQTAAARQSLVAFDEGLRGGEDVEWWIRLAHQSRVATVCRVGLLYRHHDGERFGSDALVRAESLRRILDMHANYFAAHPRATAFHLKRIGLTALRGGDRRAARRAFTRSLWARPQPRTLWHLGRSYRRVG